MHVVRPMGSFHEGVVEPYRSFIHRATVLANARLESTCWAVPSNAQILWQVRGQYRHRMYGLRREIDQRCLFKWKSEGKEWLDAAVSRETRSTLTRPSVDDSRKASALHKHRAVHPALAHQSSKRAHFSHSLPSPPFQFSHASATIALLTAALPTIGRIIHSSLPCKLASFAASRC